MKKLKWWLPFFYAACFITGASIANLGMPPPFIWHEAIGLIVGMFIALYLTRHE